MKIKKDVDISTSDFWYDISDGGYLDPYEICKTVEDANKVYEATNVLRDFYQSCEDQIEGFIQ